MSTKSPGAGQSADSATATIPDWLVDLLTTNKLGHVTTVAGDGSLVTHVVWVDFDGEHVLMSSPTGSHKGRNMRARPQVAVSVIDPANAGRSLSITGHVAAIRDDDGLAFINKLSQRYTGGPYARSEPREVFVVVPDRVRFPDWAAATEWPTSGDGGAWQS